MKAIRVHQFGDPSVLKLEEVPALKPGPGQLLIRIDAIGINPVETYIRSGIYGARQFPFTPGTDAGGVVDEIGAGVTKFNAGDRVYTSGSTTGTYAQKCLCAEAQVHRLPEKITFQQGAAMGVPYATAYRALFNRGNARAGETVFIHGASGGVGTAAVQLAHAWGLRVMGTAGTEQGKKLVEEQGADEVLNHHEKDYLKKLMDLTGGRGVDLIIELAAHINLGKDLPVLAKQGRVVVVGSRGPVEINPRDAMGRDSSILPMSLMNATEPELAGIHAALVAGLDNGILRPIVGKEMPLAEAARAHEEVLKPGSHGKIVLLP